jgi:hypothetical protein
MRDLLFVIVIGVVSLALLVDLVALASWLLSLSGAKDK